MEDVSPANLAKFKWFTDYAHGKGLMVGGYSLLASRHIDEANDVINPKTGKPGGAIFGDSPCLGSEWGIKPFEHIKAFLATSTTCPTDRAILATSARRPRIPATMVCPMASGLNFAPSRTFTPGAEGEVL